LPRRTLVKGGKPWIWKVGIKLVNLTEKGSKTETWPDDNTEGRLVVVGSVTHCSLRVNITQVKWGEGGGKPVGHQRTNKRKKFGKTINGTWP